MQVVFKLRLVVWILTPVGQGKCHVRGRGHSGRALGRCLAKGGHGEAGGLGPAGGSWSCSASALGDAPCVSRLDMAEKGGSAFPAQSPPDSPRLDRLGPRARLDPHRGRVCADCPRPESCTPPWAGVKDGWRPRCVSPGFRHKHHRLGGDATDVYFLQAGVQKLELCRPTRPASVESPLAGSGTATFSQRPRPAGWGERETERALWSLFAEGH